jgi:hypothetical protein
MVLRYRGKNWEFELIVGNRGDLRLAAFDTTPFDIIPLRVWAPIFLREVTLHDWFGASRSANARQALEPRTGVSP